MTAYRTVFDDACDRLGWRRVVVKVEHERDWNRSGDEDVWLNKQGQRLFAESDLTEAMAQEIVRIAATITNRGFL